MQVELRAQAPATVSCSEQKRAGPSSGAFHADDTPCLKLDCMPASNTEGPTSGRPLTFLKLCVSLEIWRVPGASKTRRLTKVFITQLGLSGQYIFL